MKKVRQARCASCGTVGVYHWMGVFCDYYSFVWGYLMSRYDGSVRLSVTKRVNTVDNDAPGPDRCDYCSRHFINDPACQCTISDMRAAHVYGLANPPVTWGTGCTVPESCHPFFFDDL